MPAAVPIAVGAYMLLWRGSGSKTKAKAKAKPVRHRKRASNSTTRHAVHAH